MSAADFANRLFLDLCLVRYFSRIYRMFHVWLFIPSMDLSKLQEKKVARFETLLDADFHDISIDLSFEFIDATLQLKDPLYECFDIRI